MSIPSFTISFGGGIWSKETPIYDAYFNGVLFIFFALDPRLNFFLSNDCTNFSSFDIVDDDSV